ncbi:MAG TPA: hypothetical protein VMZ73_09460 [Acidimicrobiales bacterium]|nr:hypothetical protein [Acidimicrobiales bacterium]
MRGRSQRDERGAILVLSAAGMVIALIASALAIDIGRVAQSAREDQKVADMAALDAVRGTPANYQTLAAASALRNGFPTDTGYSVVAVEGMKVNGACLASAGAGSACVTVTSPHTNRFPFVGGRNSVTRAGVASNTALGGFYIGSSLVTLDTSRSAILDRVMGGILRGSGLSVSGVSWSGLTTANITLDALRTQLVNGGVSAGTVSELMNANLTMNQLLTATAAAMTSEGETAGEVAVLNALKAQVTNTTLATFKLGQFMTVASGADNTALASELNVFQFVTAAAQVANGSNFINVSNVGITVPNVSSTKVSLQVIEPPQYYFGPVGGSKSTGQISLTVTPTLNLPVTVAGLTSVVVTNDLPVKVTGAGATGTLSAATCGTGGGITVTVDPKAFSGSATASLNARVSLLVPIADITIPTTNVTPSTDGGPTNLSFNYPSEFPPPLGTTTSKHAGSQPIGLGTLTQISAGTPTVQLLTLTPLPVPVGNIVTAVLNALGPVLASVDNNVLTPLLQVLGLDIGSADVTADRLQCNTPTLSG